MFSRTYADARLAFIAALTNAGGRLEDSHEHPLRGPGGERLFMDVGIWGKGGGPTLVLVSGTHGIEGFVGSAVQTALLHRWPAPPAGLRVVFVHAVNPYGFAWCRRANEAGIDLNRNFVDFDKPLPANPHFDTRLAMALVPASDRGLPWAAATAWLLLRIMLKGMEAMKQAVAAGQYEHPRAPFYGGTAPAWSNTVFREVVSRHLAEPEGPLSLIDYHSGLGKRGTAQLIAADHADDSARAMGRRLWGTGFVNGADGVAYEVTGDLISAVHRQFEGRSNIVTAAHEHGTQPVIKVLNAIRFDHVLHARGTPGAARLAACEKAMRDAFCPDDSGWRQGVLELSMAAIDQAVRGLLSGGP